jgi:hypothetical protein
VPHETPQAANRVVGRVVAGGDATRGAVGEELLVAGRSVDTRYKQLYAGRSHVPTWFSRRHLSGS